MGLATLAVVMLTLRVGWQTASPWVGRSLAAIYLVFAAVVSAIILLDAPGGPLRLWLGLPAPTGLLVYGIWPLGILPSLLFAFRFHDTVLPHDRLERFLAEHSRRRK